MIRAILTALIVAVLACAVAASPARAEFGIQTFTAALMEPSTVEVPGTANILAAGAHPDLVVELRTTSRPTATPGETEPDGNLRSFDVGLPQGLVVDPSAAPTCEQKLIEANACPANAQVGFLDIRGTLGPGNDDIGLEGAPLYNMARPEGAPAQFAIYYNGNVIKLNGRVDGQGAYHLAASLTDLTQAAALFGGRVTLWGVPTDPVHDEFRTGPNTAPRRAFVTNPTSCNADAAEFTVSATSWQDSTRVVRATDADEPDGTPFVFSDCTSLPFGASASVFPSIAAPDSPTGLGVSVTVPQSASPDRRATAHVREVKVTLPPGMTVNPSAAAGLGACSSAQIAIASTDAATCPSTSKLGSVSIDTPLLPAPLTGDVFLAAQGDNPFGTLLGLYLEAQGSNVRIKLAGRIDLDPGTGQLAATFSDNPQLPFTRLDVRLDDGARAVLATPPACGPHTATVELTPWSGGPATTASSSFAIDCAAGLGTFAPSFGAGTGQPLAGATSPLIVNLARPDGQAQLNGLSLNLPTGLLAKLRGVPRCPDTEADAGTCDAGSRVGGASVLVGAGAQPFPLAGEVFLTGPYKGAPFGLAVRVRAIAGPLDLGTVIVRQALSIDAEDTHVTVVSDPLPTILQGIPIRLRRLDVNVDRADFVVNPTSCAPKSVGATLGAVDGRTATQSVAFRVGGCDGLRLTPKLTLGLRGRRTGLRDGGHPALRALLTQPAKQSNLRTARVVLPLSLSLDPDNAQTLCEAADGAKPVPSCPKGSVVGIASATTPLLDAKLTGPVYFVKGQRKDPNTGRIIRTLPTLVVPLSGDGVRITLRAKTAVSDDRLVTTFERIPDAPVSRFDLRLSGGKNGILVTNGNACKRSRKLGVVIRGQNGVTVKNGPTLAAACPKKKQTKKRRAR